MTEEKSVDIATKEDGKDNFVMPFFISVTLNCYKFVILLIQIMHTSANCLNYYFSFTYTKYNAVCLHIRYTL